MRILLGGETTIGFGLQIYQMLAGYESTTTQTLDPRH